MTAPGFTGTAVSDRAQPFLTARCVQVLVQRDPLQHLSLPEDPATPVILVGAGAAGIVPFRTIIEQRKAAGATGEHWLLFGDLGAETVAAWPDREWILGCSRDGTLNRLDASLPFDTGASAELRQRMFENARGLWAWIDLGASVYVCGEPARLGDVEATLAEVIAEQGRMSDDHAAAYLAEMARDRRYQRYFN